MNIIKVQKLFPSSMKCSYITKSNKSDKTEINGNHCNGVCREESYSIMNCILVAKVVSKVECSYENGGMKNVYHCN